MKKHLFTIVILIIFLVGLSVLLYPVVSDFFIARSQARVVESYHEFISQMDESEIDALLEAAHAYNERLRYKPNRHVIYNPNHEEFSQADLAEYNSLLNVSHGGIMGALEIDFINVNLPIYHSTSDEVLQIGIGHFEGTSLPVGGEGTHAVITGHRGLPSATLLSNIDRMEEGDIFVIRVLNRRLVYQVDQIVVVEPHDFKDLEIFPDMDLVTLLTCHPYGINTHRLLVRGHRIGDESSVTARRVILSQASNVSSIIIIAAIVIPALAVIAIVRFCIYLKSSRKPPPP